MVISKGYFDEKELRTWIIPIPNGFGEPLRPTRHGSVRDKYDRSKRLHYTITKMVWWQPSDNPECIYVLQELNYKEQIHFRLGYYTLSTNGLWYWGQWAPILSKKDYEDFHNYAVEMGLFIL